MRPALFVICFTLGVSLMVFSGYLPQPASASGGSSDMTMSSDNSTDPRVPTFIPVFRAGTPWPSPSPAEPEPDPEPLDESARADEATSDEAPADMPETIEAPADEAAPAENVAPADVGVILDPPVPDPPAGDPDAWMPPETIVDEVAVEAEEAEEAEETEATPPVADAGRDAVVWSGWNELRLDGSGSAGQDLAYQWRQVAGPAALTIVGEYAAVTSAVGLSHGEEMGWAEAVYEFELTVTDEHGERSFDTVEFVVKAAPDITIVPAAERFFELRDGYLLGHAVAEAVNLETERTTFEIVSPTALVLTKVGGDEYVVVEDVSDYAYVYQVTLQWQSGVSETWVEFLVDTGEKIPGIVQLAVSWE